MWRKVGISRTRFFILPLIRFTNMPYKCNNNIPSFIITDMVPVQTPFSLSPTSPDATSGLDTNSISPSIVLLSHSGPYFRATMQLRGNELEQNLLGLTTEAPLNYNIPRQNRRASDSHCFASQVLTIQPGSDL